MAVAVVTIMMVMTTVFTPAIVTVDPVMPLAVARDPNVFIVAPIITWAVGIIPPVAQIDVEIQGLCRRGQDHSRRQRDR